MNPDLKAPWRSPLDLACFLLGGLCLTVPSGYALAGVLLWVIGMRRLWSGQALPLLRAPLDAADAARSARRVVLACLAYGLMQVFVHFYHGNGLRELDDTLPFVFAPLIWFALRGQPSRPSWLAWGFVAGALGCLAVALWQYLVKDAARASGFTFVIQFGNLCIWLGLASLSGLVLVDGQDGASARRLRAGAVLGFLAGLFASVLSGTRGGWLALLPALPVLWLACRASHWLRLHRAARLAAIALLLLLAALLLRSPVHDRIAMAASDWRAWADHGQTEGSLNERIALWSIARTIIAERPLLGHSRAEYVARRDAIVAERHYAEVVRISGSHVHNDVLQALVRGGVFSASALCIMYLLPLLLAWRSLRARDPVLRHLATLIVLLDLCYLVFGLTQTFLNHNSGRMVFAIGMPVLVCLWANRLQAHPAVSSGPDLSPS